MIVYTATKSEFNADVVSNAIADKILNKFKEKLGRITTKQEIESWRNSMLYMNNILLDKAIPGSAGVSIEYRIPQTSNRIDFVLTGKNKNKGDVAIIIELKQWTDVKRTNKDAIVETFVGKAVRQVSHPSYQAWTYAALLRDFNETIREENIALMPCAYLHNCEAYDAINHSFYQEHIAKAPIFLKNDAQRLGNFIKQHVKYGDSANIMYRIDNGKIKPSKNLADTLVSLMQGKPEFMMIDSQKLVFETALALAEQSTINNKQVLIVEGGPGTGKSIVAINLLVEFTRREKLVQYVTKNAAPRQVYRSTLTGSYTKSHIDNLFKGSGSYTDAEPNTFDVLVVDEAHRLNEKSGMFQNLGENQIKEIINATKHSVFFIDEDQRVTWKDIGEKQEIRKWAEHIGANVQELELTSQFRCNGSDGYLAWIDAALQIRKTANENLERIDYDFQVFDSPNDLRDTIFAKNRLNNKARLVAGYCWDWVSKKDPMQDDIVLKDPAYQNKAFSMKWNLDSDGSLWIMKPETVTEIGCIHTCQGLELDYIGIIVGPDLIVRDGKIITRAEQRSKMDSSIKGYKTLFKKKPDIAKRRADSIIKNTYRTLMTRGQKGCYLYCTDPETNKYFQALAKDAWIEKQTELQEDREISEQQSPLPFRILTSEEVKPFENSVPVYDLKIAAGKFSEEQIVEEAPLEFNSETIKQHQWMELPDVFRPQPGLFVAQVIGESMNKRIPNGAWCLFKFKPTGTRNGKVVLVQHRDIHDIDTGEHYTVKLYESEKIENKLGEWHHSRIMLKPCTTALGYDPIVLEPSETVELKIIAELIAVLS